MKTARECDVEKIETLLVALMGVSWKCDAKASATRRNPVGVGTFRRCRRWRTFPSHFSIVWL